MFGRGEITRGRATVIRDCYNSNPESLREAVAFCDEVEWPGRRVYVMGSMLELGDVSRAAHGEMGALLADSKADMVYLFGNETAAAAAVLETRGSVRFFHTCDMDALFREVDCGTEDGDLVLLKGSRGCALERLCPAFEGGRKHVSGNI